MRRLTDTKQAATPFVWAQLRYHLIEAARLGNEIGLKAEPESWREAANFCTDQINSLLDVRDDS